MSESHPTTGNISAEGLKSFVKRIERLEEEKKVLSSDIKDIFADAKAAGFDVKVLRQLVRERKREPAEIEEQEMLLDLYRRAIGSGPQPDLFAQFEKENEKCPV